MTLLALAACSSGVAYGQNQAKMLELHNQAAVEEPLNYATAQQLLEGGAGGPEFIDYTLLPGVTLGGLSSGSPFFLESTNTIAADTIGTDELRANGALRLGLQGDGTTIGMWEVSDPLLTHPEFTDGGTGVRVIDADGPKPGMNPLRDRWHATHVAGTMIARGANPLALGMSPNATLRAYDTDLQFAETTGIFSNATTADDLQISNHSYGRVAGWWTTYTHTNNVVYPVWSGDITVSSIEDFVFGFYDDNARQIDQIAYLQETYLPVWSAGNDRLQTNATTVTNQPSGTTTYVAFVGTALSFVTGTYPAADGIPAGFDSMTSYGCAKNVLTVAAANDLVGGWTSAASVTLANFSGAGPTDDGRIKPDLAANGVGVLSSDDPSTSPFNTTQNYFSYNGTSQAAPGVTGSINLLIQYFRQLYGTATDPWASTVKGWVIHTADEAGASPGPDYRNGWGLMNTTRAASLIRANKEASGSPFVHQAQVANGGTWSLTVTAVGGQPLKVTVPWTDVAGTVTASAVDSPVLKLINDLDVIITGPGGVVTRAWMLDPANPANAATRGDNTRDNLEQVLIDAPVAGAQYVITVAPSAGENLVDETGAAAPQPFSVLISGTAVEHSTPIPITLTQTGATTFDLTWAPLPGLIYDLETSDNLITWTTLQNDQSYTLTPNITSVTRSASEPKRFWRFKTNP
jgi:hypothetical protein